MVVDKQNSRFFLLMALTIVGMLLYNAWQIEHMPKPTQSPTVSAQGKGAKNSTREMAELPAGPTNPKQTLTPTTEDGAVLATAVKRKLDSTGKILVETDVFKILIDSHGGDILRVELPKYPEELLEEKGQANKRSGHGFTLLDNSEARYYIAQSGLLSEAGPDSATAGRAQYSSAKSSYKMVGDGLAVDLVYLAAGVEITKRFSFERGSYAVNVEYLINNKSAKTYEGSFFGRLRRAKAEEASSSFLGPMKTYTGAAVNTPEKAYKKISFDDMEKKSFKQFVVGGWAAFIEHYFTSAWIPAGENKNYYQSEVFADKSYAVGFVGQQVSVAPGQQEIVSAKLYMGPRITAALKELASGLELTVDFGALWWLSQPIFVLLKWLYSLVNNWGIAIILVTVSIKLAFFKLSATSYRSMGNMKKLQPRIEALKQRFADDKQQFSQAVMALYKTEKVNPFGGCLPMLIQIPVFIALYYVLLESVELRHAPFGLWIKDLSVKDPFYILPLLMGATMVLQQRMNPAPPDPMQAKVMMAMPLVFTVLFLNFPSGLVLYWVVNNSLSIVQQWVITRGLEADGNKGNHKEK